MPPDVPVIRNARELSQLVRLGSILRLPRQEMLLQAEAARLPPDALRETIGREKSRTLDHLQTFGWQMALQGSLSGIQCRLESRFYDSRSDRHSVRLKVYSRAAALCRSGRPSLEQICRTAALDLPYTGAGTNPHCVSSALREGGGVCQAIAHYLCQLLLRCGYPCVVRTGEVNGVSHAWNQVLAEGRWQRVDLCVSAPAAYRDTTALPPSQQYAEMCGSLDREVILEQHASTVNGVTVPFYIADRRWVCPTRFVQCFNGAYTLESGHLLLCLGSAVRQLPLSCLRETPEHLPYMDVQQFARLLRIPYGDHRLCFTEGL